LFNFLSAAPKVEGKYCAGACWSCAEYGGVQQSVASIPSQAIKDDRKEDVMTGMKKYRGPQAVRFQPKPRKHEAHADAGETETTKRIPGICSYVIVRK
jgi:hypothetical protein